MPKNKPTSSPASKPASATPPAQPAPAASRQVRNLEFGLRKVMVHAFSSKGISKAEAEAKASANMASAVARFHKAQTKIATESAVSRSDFDDRITRALKNRARGGAAPMRAKPVPPSAPKHVKLAAEFKQRTLTHRGVSGPLAREDATAGLAMRAVAAWAKKLP